MNITKLYSLREVALKLLPANTSDRHKLTSLCHLLQFLAIGIYAIMRRNLVRGIPRERPVARGRVALQVAATAKDLVPSAEGNPLARRKSVDRFIRSNRAQLLLANHRLRSASNLQFSCRPLPPSNSDSGARCGGFLAQLWPQNC